MKQDPRGLSACAIHLSRNPHDVTQCDANTLCDGHTSYARKGDKGAKLQISTSGVSLCLDWDLPRSCNSNLHLARHRCSGCGSNNHGAQCWKNDGRRMWEKKTSGIGWVVGKRARVPECKDKYFILNK
jgi:hypothetical protein